MYFFVPWKAKYIENVSKRRIKGCILCKIVENSDEVLTYKLEETNKLNICLNLYPFTVGHLLIFPKRHVEDYRELDREEREEIDEAIARYMDILEELYNPKGFNVGLNQGLAAGASIKHLHFHLVPRFERELGFPEIIAGKKVMIEDLKTTQDKILKVLEKRNS